MPLAPRLPVERYLRLLVTEGRSKGVTTSLRSLASRSADHPPFFPDSDLEERTFAFLLLLEVEVGGEWFLGVFKHDVASLAEWLEDNCTPLPRTKLAQAFSDGTAVGKMTLRRMTASKHELRRASYEAVDLQTSLPMMATGRSAISSLRFDGSDGSFSVTPSTSRVQRSGGRCTVEGLAAMVRLIATATRSGKANPFLEAFAQAVPINELPADVTPNSILFDWGELLETDAMELCRLSRAVGEEGSPVRKAVLLRLLGETVPVLPDGSGWQFAHNPAKSLGRFSRTASKYSVRQLLWDLVFVRDTRMPVAKPVSLAKWVRDNDAYAITFTNPRYFFCGGALYFRAAFAKEVDLVRRCQGTKRDRSDKGESPHKSHRRASIERQHGIQQNLCAGRCIGLSNRFSLVMAETACARNKDHGSRCDLRDIHSVVAGTRDNFACREPFFLNAGSNSSNTTHVEDHRWTIQDSIQRDAGG
jgi:hypothetical protein